MHDVGLRGGTTLNFSITRLRPYFDAAEFQLCLKGLAGRLRCTGIPCVDAEGVDARPSAPDVTGRASVGNSA